MNYATAKHRNYGKCFRENLQRLRETAAEGPD